MLKEHPVKDLQVLGRVAPRWRSKKWIVPGAEVTVKRWAKLPKAPRGMVVAVIDDKATVLWSSYDTSLDDFSHFMLPIVRRVFTPLIANQLVSIQPMTLPAGNIFYMDYTYGQSSESIGGAMRPSGGVQLDHEPGDAEEPE